MTSVPDFSQRRAYARSVVLRLGLDEYGPEYQALIGGQPTRPQVEVKAAALPQPGPGRVQGPQVRPPAPRLDRRGGRGAGLRTGSAPRDPGRVHGPDRGRRAGKPLEAVLEAAATETDRRFLRGLAVEAFAAEEPGVR